MQPSRLVSIDSRKHIPKNATRTRLGVGEQFFDHAAGKPLAARQSFAGIPEPTQDPQYVHGIRNSVGGRHYVIAPAAPNDWDDQPNLHQREQLRDVLQANDAPVDLPLKSRTKMYLVVAGLVVAFVAMLAGTFLAGGTSQSDELDTAPAAPAQPRFQSAEGP